jgi:hypothetical protein
MTRSQLRRLEFQIYSCLAILALYTLLRSRMF